MDNILKNFQKQSQMLQQLYIETWLVLHDASACHYKCVHVHVCVTIKVQCFAATVVSLLVLSTWSSAKWHNWWNFLNFNKIIVRQNRIWKLNVISYDTANTLNIFSKRLHSIVYNRASCDICYLDAVIPNSNPKGEKQRMMLRPQSVAFIRK